MSIEPLSSNFEAESDDDLRRVYGADARFTRVGPFTLCHMDAPTDEVMAKRTAEFSPDEFFGDDNCPLCQASRSHGGHIVFSDSQNDDASVYNAEHEEVDGQMVLDALCNEDVSPVFAATPLKAPAVALLRALDRLDVAADELVCALEPIASAELLKRTIEDVGFMHDRFVESMWAEESPARLELFEQQLAQATETLAVVRAAHEPLASHVTLVTAALDTIAGIWRGL